MIYFVSIINTMVYNQNVPITDTHIHKLKIFIGSALSVSEHQNECISEQHKKNIREKIIIIIKKWHEPKKHALNVHVHRKKIYFLFIYCLPLAVCDSVFYFFMIPHTPHFSFGILAVLPCSAQSSTQTQAHNLKKLINVLSFAIYL